MLVATAVLPFAAFIAYQIGEIRERRASEALQTAHQFAQMGADSYQDTIAEARTVLELIARLPEVTEGSADMCHQALVSVERARRWANGMWVVGQNGRVRCTTIAHGIGLDLSGRPEYERAVAADGFTVSDFFVTKLRKAPAALAALPVFSKQTGERLLLAVTLDLEWFDRLAANIGKRAGANIVLLDGVGTVVSGYPHEQSMTGQMFANLTAVQKILDTASGQFEGERLDGKHAYWGYVTLPQTNLRLVVSFERAKVLANLERGTRHAVVMFAFVALFIGAVIWFAGKRFFTNPMRELDDLLQATLDNMDQGVIVVDRHGTLPICNERAIQLLDLPPTLMRDRPTADAVLEFQRSRGEFENLSEAVRERLHPRLHGEVHNVYERQRPNGTILEIRTAPFTAGGVVRTYTDVTARRQAEQRLQKTKAFLDTVVENIPLPIVVKDPRSLEFVLINRAYEKFVGLPRDRILGKTIEEILPAEMQRSSADATGRR